MAAASQSPAPALPHLPRMDNYLQGCIEACGRIPTALRATVRKLEAVEQAKRAKLGVAVIDVQRLNFNDLMTISVQRDGILKGQPTTRILDSKRFAVLNMKEGPYQGAYLVLKRILLGKGLYKAVYDGIKLDTFEPVAILSAYDAEFGRESSIKQITHEQQFLKFLQRDSNFLRLYGSVSKEDQLYVVVEKAEQDLFDYCHSMDPKDKLAQARMAIQIATALYTLHAMDVIHRDIKMENVQLVGKDAKLSDFDYAITISDEEERRTIWGTPQCVAPELAYARIKGDDDLKATFTDKPADIWAFGQLLTALFGKTGYPWTSLSQDESTEFLANIYMDHLEFLSGQAPHDINVVHPKLPVDPPIHKLLTSMLSMDPEKRPTIQQVIKELRDYEKSLLPKGPDAAEEKKEDT